MYLFWDAVRASSIREDPNKTLGHYGLSAVVSAEAVPRLRIWFGRYEQYPAVPVSAKR
jgi:hypothetical protein